MSAQKNILVVDDDTEIRNLLAKLLKEYNFTVYTAADGIELFDELAAHDIDLIILDLMLPGDDGLTLCRKLRAENQTIPIIMLTAVGEEMDRVVGLEIGADDYISKPFNPRELIARIRAVMRRTENLSIGSHDDDQRKKSQQVQFSGWTMNLGLHSLIDPDGVEIQLSSGEYALLKVFIESPKRVLSRDHLLEILHNRPAGPFDRSIDIQVSRLRQKIESDPKNPLLIKTVRGGGYIFASDVVTVRG